MRKNAKAICQRAGHRNSIIHSSSVTERPNANTAPWGRQARGGDDGPRASERGRHHPLTCSVEKYLKIAYLAMGLGRGGYVGYDR